MNNYSFYENQIAGQKDQIYDYFPVIASNGDFKRLSGIDVPINAIRNLLLTPLGQYPFDPNFGSLLYKQIFEPLDDISLEVVRYECQDRIRQYYDRVTVESVKIYSSSSVSTSGKAIQVEVNILRNKIPGKVTLVVPNRQVMFGTEDDLNPELQAQLQNNKEMLMRIDKLRAENYSYEVLWQQYIEGKAFVSDSEKIVIHTSICQTLNLGVI
jgi:phage baseplate assembly protein W